jgi:hypothetical protein
MKLSDIRVNPKNPRIIKDDKFRKLVKSLKEFPQMMELRPIIVDDDGIIQGGNMRYKALRELGYSEVPDGWVKQGRDLTPEQWREFVVKDNLGYGEFNFDDLANEFEIGTLENWGVDLPKDIENIKETKDIPDVGEVEFSDEMLLEHNYIVLYFNNPFDWEVAKQKYNLKIVRSNDPAEKVQKIGIGRVIDGSKYL